MNSTKRLLHRTNHLIASTDKRAQLRYQLSKQLEESWNFEAAREITVELMKSHRNLLSHPVLQMAQLVSSSQPGRS